MNIKQLSVFVENKAGSLVKVFRLFKEEGIQLIVSTISDTADNGICRIICNEPQRAFEALRGAGMTVSLNDVFAIEIDDIPGKAADTIATLSDESVEISYLYSFLYSGKGILVFRTPDPAKAREVIVRNGFTFPSYLPLAQ